MAAHSQIPEVLAEKDFLKGLRWSLYAHGILFLIILIKCVVFPTRPAMFISTLRVDIVGLPDVLKKDLNRMPKGPATNLLTEALKKAEIEAKKLKSVQPKMPQEKVNPDELVHHPKPQAKPQAKELDRKKRLKNALDRIKALSKISSDIDSKPAVPMKGNIISPGTSLSGDAKEAAQASYFDTLRDKLQENWALPVWIARQNFSAQVQIFIDSRGRLHSYKFTKISGNAQFDEAVKRTLTESQPFPAPPIELVPSLFTDGILVGFPL